MQHQKKQSHLLYQKAVPSRCDRGGIAIMVGHSNWPDICMVACSVGAIPYTYKKISDMEQISEQPTDI
jgi:hypothetical protein